MVMGSGVQGLGCSLGFGFRVQCRISGFCGVLALTSQRSHL